MSKSEYLWRLPLWANQKFERLLSELEDEPEGSENHFAIVEEIKSLPNFPNHSQQYSLIRREITTVGEAPIHSLQTIH